MTALMPLYIKKAYNEDPFFANSKVIYSLYDNDYKVPFDSDFSEKVLIEGIKKNDLTSIANDGSFNSLSKLAIDFSDGIIQGSEKTNTELIEYAKKSKKMFLPYQTPENYVNSYDKFYDEILGL